MVKKTSISSYPDILSVQDIQQILSIGRNSAYRLIQDGRIRSVRIGRCIRIPKQFLLDFLNNPDYDRHDSYTSSLSEKDGDMR